MADRVGSFQYLSGSASVTFTFGEDYTYDSDQQSVLKVTPLFRSNSVAWADGRGPRTITVQCWGYETATSTTLSDIETKYRERRQNALDKSGTLTIKDENGTNIIAEAGWFLSKVSKPRIYGAIVGKNWVAEIEYTFVYP